MKTDRSGWRSIKAQMSLICLATLTGVFLYSVHVTGQATGWAEYCFTVAAISGIFGAGNVAATFAQRPGPVSAQVAVSTPETTVVTQG